MKAAFVVVGLFAAIVVCTAVSNSVASAVQVGAEVEADADAYLDVRSDKPKRAGPRRGGSRKGSAPRRRSPPKKAAAPRRPSASKRPASRPASKSRPTKAAARPSKAAAAPVKKTKAKTKTPSAAAAAPASATAARPVGLMSTPPSVQAGKKQPPAKAPVKAPAKAPAAKTPVGKGKAKTKAKAKQQIVNSQPVVAGPGEGVTADQLQKIMTKTKCSTTDKHGKKHDCSLGQISAKRAAADAPMLNNAMKEFGITGKADEAAFLANVGQESNNLAFMKELGTGAEYEGRKNLGNTQKGDGKKFKGRGPIQTTGRANYDAAGKALGLDLVNHPELLDDPATAFRASAYFWKSNNLNEAAAPNTEDSFKSTVRTVNGAIIPSTHYENRKTIWDNAESVLNN